MSGSYRPCIAVESSCRCAPPCWHQLLESSILMHLLPDHINSLSNQNTEIFQNLPKASYIPFLFITSKPVSFPFSSIAPYLKSFRPLTLQFWNFLPFFATFSFPWLQILQVFLRPASSLFFFVVTVTMQSVSLCGQWPLLSAWRASLIRLMSSSATGEMSLSEPRRTCLWGTSKVLSWRGCETPAKVPTWGAFCWAAWTQTHKPPCVECFLSSP